MNRTSAIDVLYEQGIALLMGGQAAAAAETFAKAVAHDPSSAYCHNAHGLALAALGRSDEALRSFDAAVRLAPGFASPYINRSLILRNRGDLKAALASLDRAVALQPDNPNAHGNRGGVLTELEQPIAAVASLDRALQLNPAYPLLAGIRLLNKMLICDWAGIDRDLATVAARVERGELATPPWPLVGLSNSPALQCTVAERWIAAECPENPALGPLVPYPRRDRIRLGYFSADFHRHATAYLIAELLERHDRDRFEVIAFSFGNDTGDDMQKRLMMGVDRFIDVRARSDRDIAALSREMEIDIAVDLKGITAGHRLGIFAHRAAPIQVNYLGYPGTTGAPYIDYLIADETVIPADTRRFYTEKVVALPHSYQVNDTRRKVADRIFSRAELGLPEKGFVFCCLNNNFKITPEVFDVWMRILKAVEGSVLWLLGDSVTAMDNLRREAIRRGVDATRLVFAARIAPEEHLARQRVADLFLDTLPCNAHTTASDALWVDLPVLTCPGATFAGRVAASVLRAMDLPELIMPTLADYEALAVALARDPARLQSLKEKIVRNRMSTPLFDTKSFVRDIEAIYDRIYADLYSAQAI